MKKLLIALASAFCILLISSCAKTPEDECISIINDATEQIKKAETPADIIKIGAETYKTLEKFTDELTPEEKEKLFNDEKVQKASDEFSKACKEKGSALMNKGIDKATDNLKDKAGKAADDLKEKAGKATDDLKDKAEEAKKELEEKVK